MIYNYSVLKHKKNIFFYVLFLFNLFIFCSFFAHVQEPKTHKAVTFEQPVFSHPQGFDKITPPVQKNYPVKVLLSEEKHPKNPTWTLKCQDGFLLSDVTKDTKLFYFKSDTLVITIKNGFIYTNKKKYLRKNLKIYPKSGYLSYNGNSYQGNFLVTFDETSAFLINKLDLEDYVFGVLRSESWPGWPIEVNKVFSIAIRTYVVYRVRQAKKCKRIYHVKNDNSHQTYNGHEFRKRNSDALRKAVEQTKGILLAYNGDIIDPMYDSCCGGVITSHIEDKINFEKAPYLGRDYPCKYCQQCSLYNWEVCYTLDQIEKILSVQCPYIKNIRALWVSKKDKAGLVKEITIQCAGHMYKISGDKLYTFLKEVKSFCFSIKKKVKILRCMAVGMDIILGFANGVRDKWCESYLIINRSWHFIILVLVL